MTKSMFNVADTLFLGTLDDGLKLYDVADARQPKFIRCLFDSEEITVFHAADGLLYARRPEKGIAVYEIGDGSYSKEIGHFHTGLQHDGFYRNGLVYHVGRSVSIIKFAQ